jgi:hypothetical protein
MVIKPWYVKKPEIILYVKKNRSYFRPLVGPSLIKRPRVVPRGVRGPCSRRELEFVPNSPTQLKLGQFFLDFLPDPHKKPSIYI